MFAKLLRFGLTDSAGKCAGDGDFNAVDVDGLGTLFGDVEIVRKECADLEFFITSGVLDLFEFKETITRSDDVVFLNGFLFHGGSVADGRTRASQIEAVNINLQNSENFIFLAKSYRRG